MKQKELTVQAFENLSFRTIGVNRSDEHHDTLYGCYSTDPNILCSISIPMKDGIAIGPPQKTYIIHGCCYPDVQSAVTAFNRIQEKRRQAFNREIDRLKHLL